MRKFHPVTEEGKRLGEPLDGLISERCFHCRQILMPAWYRIGLTNIIWSVCNRPDCQEKERRWEEFKR